jgi:hypothetical protein
VTQCCLQVAAWARRSGLARTAVAFAQAGALVSPRYAEAAVHVGAYARAAGGQEARAGTWLRRALGLARRERDRTAYSVALVELGLAVRGQSRGAIPDGGGGAFRSYGAEPLARLKCLHLRNSRKRLLLFKT